MAAPHLDDTIAAISTPLGESGIGIVRLSGPRALAIADEVFVSKDGLAPSAYETHTVHYGHVRDPDATAGGYVDEAILTVMRAPKSYTKEDVVEINCHGGPCVMRRALEVVIRRGSRLAEPGEFTKRAFLNGRIDLAQAEAVLDIIRAKTDAALRVAVSQLDGVLSHEVDGIIERLSRIASHIEAAIDFPDEDIEIMEEADAARALGSIQEEIAGLISTADEGIVLREGICATICGKPNVGKSSLMNVLLKRDRVIVTPIPGTTRDAVEETINLKGFPIRMVDTAGISDAKDMPDREGVERSRRYIERADIVLFVFDSTRPIEKEDLDIRDIVKGKKVLAILNKIDLPQALTPKDVHAVLDGARTVSVSVTERMNIDLLEEELVGQLESGGVMPGEGAVVTRARHKRSLEDASAHIREAIESLDKGLSAEFVAYGVREAILCLGTIIGKTLSDDILDRIFGEFCIGK